MSLQLTRSDMLDLSLRDGRAAELHSVSPTMFTLFDFMMLIGAVCGLIAGVLLGKPFGAWAAVGGGAAGLIVGYIAGQLPCVIAWFCLRRNLKIATTDQLRERIENEYYISHLIIAELVTRGEPVESFREVIDNLRQSDSSEIRKCGETNARLWLSEDGEAG